MGAQRWLDLKIFLLQPSEIAKVCIVLALARFYHSTSFMAINQVKNIVLPLIFIAIMVGLVVVQPDLGTAIVLAAIGIAIMFLCGVDKKFFISGIIMGLAAIPVLWNFVMLPYQKNRVLTFMNPENDPLGAGYHIMQSNIAIGSSDFFGKGFLQGTQSRLEFLPEKHTDFIFTLLVEDFGMFGAMLLLTFFALFLYFGFSIASQVKSSYAKSVAIGITIMVFLHAVINMSMVMGLMPVVGIPLPFISYGGTSMMTMLIAVGFLLNAYVHREETLKILR
jgi:rod shape determining protein RodA